MPRFFVILCISMFSATVLAEEDCPSGPGECINVCPPNMEFNKEKHECQCLGGEDGPYTPSDDPAKGCELGGEVTCIGGWCIEWPEYVIPGTGGGLPGGSGNPGCDDGECDECHPDDCSYTHKECKAEAGVMEQLCQDSGEHFADYMCGGEYQTGAATFPNGFQTPILPDGSEPYCYNGGYPGVNAGETDTWHWTIPTGGAAPYYFQPCTEVCSRAWEDGMYNTSTDGYSAVGVSVSCGPLGCSFSVGGRAGLAGEHSEEEAPGWQKACYEIANEKDKKCDKELADCHNECAGALVPQDEINMLIIYDMLTYESF